jgi:predicted DNA binding CopG/RHH family protein
MKQNAVKEKFIMNGLQMTTMTIEQMKIAREQGHSKTDWALLRQNALNDIEPQDDEDSPDATVLLCEAVKKRGKLKLERETEKEAHLDIVLSARDFEILKMLAVKDGILNYQAFAESIVQRYLQERQQAAN